MALATVDNPLEKALRLAREIRELPENCAMRDGRKWKRIPIIIFSGIDGSCVSSRLDATIVWPMDAAGALGAIEMVFADYYKKVLDDYKDVGLLLREVKGRIQISAGFHQRKTDESTYYYAGCDLRYHAVDKWVTVQRDDQGLRADIALKELLSRGTTETEMHRFFEEHPAILMEARLGIPISHKPRFDYPDARTPDYSFTSILGPWNEKSVEVVELKGPADVTLYKGLYPGFTSKVNRAVNQVRYYDKFFRDPQNAPAITRDLGYIPDQSKLAVIIGRSPMKDQEEAWKESKKHLVDVQVVTYDEILQTQLDQVRTPYTILSGTPGYPV
jgi:hypothetical protein